MTRLVRRVICTDSNKEYLLDYKTGEIINSPDGSEKIIQVSRTNCERFFKDE